PAGTTTARHHHQRSDPQAAFRSVDGTSTVSSSSWPWTTSSASWAGEPASHNKLSADTDTGGGGGITTGSRDQDRGIIVRRHSNSPPPFSTVAAPGRTHGNLPHEPSPRSPHSSVTDEEMDGVAAVAAAALSSR
ncbi:unnamed protein product, partial [Sphacelaria rigidula]